MASDEVLKDFYAAENERLRWAVSGGTKIIDGQAARIRGLTAENARLREALASIERVPYTLDGGTEAMLDRVLSLASAALAATGGEGQA